jgi:hypothetical protein
MKIKLLIPLLLILLLPLLGRVAQTTAVAAPDNTTITLTNYDLIRNGDFAEGLSLWRKRGAGLNNAQAEAGIGMGNSTAVRIFTEADTNFATASAIVQELYLPTQTTAATIRFDVRVAQAFEGQPPEPNEAVNGWLALVPLDQNNQFDLNNAFVSGYVYENAQQGFTNWGTYEAALPADVLTALNNAHANKQRVAFVLGTIANGWKYSLLVDNVSIRVDGSRTVPNFTGEIAYLAPGTVRRISPLGGPGQTIWTHPDSTGRKLFNVRWNPTATELAFTSNHETLYSAFSTDVFGIRPNGTELRRITNAPSHAAMQASGLPRGTVRLQVTNIYNTMLDPVWPFMVYVQGAAETVSATLPNQFGTVEVIIPNVVDLGPGGQYITFIYSSHGCGANRRYVSGFVEVIGGQTVDMSVDFNATGCGISGAVEAAEIAWKRDGSEIGYIVTNAPFKIAAANPSGPGTPWWNSGLVTTIAWSPINNTVAYGTATIGIFHVNPEVDPNGTQLIPAQQGGYPSDPAWLPNGSGLLYVESGNLFYASNTGTNIRQLTFFVNEFIYQPSVSPDGNYVVFERQTGDDRVLWIMEWDNPTNMWPLIAGARPDWSRVNPSTPVPPPPSHFIYLPLVTR